MEKKTQTHHNKKKKPTKNKAKLKGKGALASSHFSALYFARFTNRGSKLQRHSPSRTATGANTAKRAKGSPDCWNKLNQIITRLFICTIILPCTTAIGNIDINHNLNRPGSCEWNRSSPPLPFWQHLSALYLQYRTILFWGLLHT